jgi:hypothetical protein
MWEPQPLTTLRASKACRGENFTFTFWSMENIEDAWAFISPVTKEEVQNARVFYTSLNFLNVL